MRSPAAKRIDQIAIAVAAALLLWWGYYVVSAAFHEAASAKDVMKYVVAGVFYFVSGGALPIFLIWVFARVIELRGRRTRSQP